MGNVAEVRNFIIQYVRDNIPQCCLIGRLDSDDFLHNDTIISEIEQLWEQNRFDVLFMGNRQQKNGIILPFINVWGDLIADNNCLSQRLNEMAIGIPTAELPSCNIFVRPYVPVKYPDVRSAEAHWYSVFLILQKQQLKVKIADDIIYCVYSLDGTITKDNRDNNRYLDSRKELYNYFVKSTKNDG